MTSKWGERLDSDKDMFGDDVEEAEYEEEQIVTVVDGRRYGRSVFEPPPASARDPQPEKPITSLKGVELTIPHFKTVRNNKGNPFTVYVLLCVGNEQSWQVFKRFSELYDLDAYLTRKGVKGLPSFPSKLGRPLESIEALTERRIKLLQSYMQVVMSVAQKKGFTQTEYLCDFLTGNTQIDGSQISTDRDSGNFAAKLSARSMVSTSDSEEDGITWTPRVTTAQTANTYTIVLEVPGCEDIITTVLDNGLRITGTRHSPVPLKTIVFNDRMFGSFVMDFDVPARFGPFSNFSAVTNMGCLTISFPPTEKDTSDTSTTMSKSPSYRAYERDR